MEHEMEDKAIYVYRVSSFEWKDYDMLHKFEEKTVNL